MDNGDPFSKHIYKNTGGKKTVNPGHVIQLHPVTLIKIRLLSRDLLSRTGVGVWLDLRFTDGAVVTAVWL